MLAVLERIQFNLKYYILRQKLLYVSVGIIGLGMGLVLAKPLCNILISPDRFSLSDIKAIFWLGIVIVSLGVVGFFVFKPRILWLSIGIIGLGIGLVLAAALLLSSLSDIKAEISSLSDIKAILGLGIVIALLGVVGFFVFKPRILWLSVGIVGLGIGLGLAVSLLGISSLSEISSSPEIIDTIFWLGIPIIGIGLMLAWVFHERVVAVTGLIVSIIVAILADSSGDRLLSSVGNIAKNTKNIGDIGTTLKDVKKHTQDTNTELEGIKDSISKTNDELGGIKTQVESINVELGGIKTQVESTNTELEGIKDSISKTNDELEGIKTQVESTNITLNRLIYSLSSINETLKKQDSLSLNKLNGQIGKISKNLKAQRKDINKIKQELGKVDSVRLLTDFEDSLKSKGFLNTDRSIRWLWLKKSHNLSKYLGTDSSSVKMVLIGQTCTLKVRSSVPIKLKRLVSHLGTLKKDKDYKMVENDSTITFINPLLGRMDVVAVVEIDKKK